MKRDEKRGIEHIASSANPANGLENGFHSEKPDSWGKNLCERLL
jgi:hypothetical protein